MNTCKLPTVRLKLCVVLTMMLDNEGSAKAECQAVCCVDDKEEDAQATSLKGCRLLVHYMRRVDEHITTSGEGQLSAKGVRGTNGSDGFFGKSSSTCAHSLKREQHIGRDELVHQSAGDTYARQDR
jgi:hypothetical protein